MKSRLLFILKSREGNWGYSGSRESGLSNSVRMLVAALNGIGIEAKAVEVQDNNCIDREVTAYRPTHVIIEAFWVVPEKFDVLKPLHPDVQWIVRDHSQTAFAACEGIIFKWSPQYLARGVELMCNAPRAVEDMAVMAIACGQDPSGVTYGPNVYHAQHPRPIVSKSKTRDTINIGSFGAVRVLKNQMTQALAALATARTLGSRLRFHINATRIEGKSEPVLHNLRGLFANARNAELVEHPWETHEGFLRLMQRERLDAVMQVSFTETFNIVAADAASMGIPVVVSPEVPWIGSYAQAPVESVPRMSALLTRIMLEDGIDDATRLIRQMDDLRAYNDRALHVWARRFC